MNSEAKDLLQEYLRYRCWAERMEGEGRIDMAETLRIAARNAMDRLARHFSRFDPAA